MDKVEVSSEKTVVKTSIIWIIANVFLAGFKAVIGLMTNSIAIVLDAVNNISYVGSSLITIVGTKLAGKEPDKKNPFGYGRIEYLSAMIISVIVLYAGITSFVESVKQIIHPETPDYNTISLVIVAVAMVVKILLGRYVKGVGVKVNSDSLINSGEDYTGFHYLRLDAGCCRDISDLSYFSGSLAWRDHIYHNHQIRHRNVAGYDLPDSWGAQ